MKLRPKGWMLLLITIFTTGYISIDNRMEANTQQQQLKKMIVTLNQIAGSKKQHKKTSPISNELIDNITFNDAKTGSPTPLFQQLQKVNAQLEKLTTQQKQLQQASSQQERELTALIQDLGTEVTPEDRQIHDQALSEQRFEQEQAEEKARIDQMMTDLENYWQNDTAISDETSVSETTLLESLSQTKDGTDIINAGCKSNMCKLELQQTAEASLADNTLLDEALEDSTVYTRAFPNSDGSQRLIMYVTQGEADDADIFD